MHFQGKDFNGHFKVVHFYDRRFTLEFRCLIYEYHRIANFQNIILHTFFRQKAFFVFGLKVKNALLTLRFETVSAIFG